MKLVYGITGTSNKPSIMQIARFMYLLKLLPVPSHWQHGDCIGVDAICHRMVQDEQPSANIVIHPPVNNNKRAMCQGGMVLPPKPYLDRNKDIATTSDCLFALPKEMDEVLRSGTWSTVRYFRKYNKKSNKKLYIILKNGDIKVEFNNKVLDLEVF